MKVLFEHVFPFIISDLSTPINSSNGHPVKSPGYVWGCFSKQRFGTLHIFTDNLNAAKMVKIYQRPLLPSVQRFMKKNENWLLQENNDPKYWSCLCTAWKQENDVDVLD